MKGQIELCNEVVRQYYLRYTKIFLTAKLSSAYNPKTFDDIPFPRLAGENIFRSIAVPYLTTAPDHASPANKSESKTRVVSPEEVIPLDKDLHQF